MAKKFEDYGVEAVIYTDIGRDGMMTGANIEATKELASSLDISVIASGGINSIDDILRLRELEQYGVTGAITGRAIYESAFDFSEANQIANHG
jgi:phosphoribosylformimino-5-aminoimidazole carboxamide ribotide isomerase